MNITLLHKKRCFYSTIIAYLRIFVFVKLRYFSRLTKDSDKLLLLEVWLEIVEILSILCIIRGKIA